MKKYIPFIAGLFFFMSSIQAQDTLTVIWEEQFDGGIPDTWEISAGMPEGAVWQWSADGEADDVLVDGVVTNARFWGQAPPIASPSADNGCAMFNSDAYDSGGGNQGDGPFPGEHFATLTSPMVDCSEFGSVALKMNQFARGLLAAPAMFFEVSVDTGATWTSFPINQEAVSGASTFIDDVVVVDISSIAANQPDVQLRFTWDGYYYFWLIDDIQLIQTPRNNLALGNYFYPPASYATPGSQIATDTFGFSALVSNLGRDDRYNVVLRATVSTEQGLLLYQDSTLLDTLPSQYMDSLVTIEATFTPEGLIEGDEYNIDYEVYSLNESDDFDPTDNNSSETFRVTASLFAKEDNTLGGTRFIGGDYDIGNFYQISPLAGPGLKALTTTTAGAKNAVDGPLIGEVVNIFFYKVKEEVLPDFSDFNTSSTGNASDQDDDLTLLGFSSFEFPPGYQNLSQAEVNLENLDGDEGIELEPGGRYFVVTSYVDGTNTIFHGVDDDIEYFQVSTVVFADSEWSVFGFGASTSSCMRMVIELASAVDEVPLPDNAINLFPNPAQEQLTVDLDLEEQGPALIMIASVEGKILLMREYDNLKDENLEFNISNYPAGAYFVRVGTEQGTKTKQFIKVK